MSFAGSDSEVCSLVSRDSSHDSSSAYLASSEGSLHRCHKLENRPLWQQVAIASHKRKHEENDMQPRLLPGGQEGCTQQEIDSTERIENMDFTGTRSKLHASRRTLRLQRCNTFHSISSRSTSESSLLGSSTTRGRQRSFTLPHPNDKIK